MSAANNYSTAGKKLTTNVDLPEDFFGVEAKNHAILQYVYNAYLANGRANLAVVKSRGMVRGGGKKPWKQKGTGRARFGSIRVPQWRGGGIVHGPRGNENYTQTVTKRTKQTALRQALSMAASENRVLVIENFNSVQGKTAQLHSLMAAMQVKGNILLVTDNITDSLSLAARNLSNIIICHVHYLNTFNIVNADYLIFTQAALDNLPQQQTKEAK